MNDINARIEKLEEYNSILYDRYKKLLLFCEDHVKNYEDLMKRYKYLEENIIDYIIQPAVIPAPADKQEKERERQVCHPPRILEQNIQELNKKLCHEAPEAYGLWKKLQANGESFYLNSPKENTSVQGNQGAEIFSAWVKNKIHGYVLDIGCGPQPCPLYLEQYPKDMITGMDPIPDTGAHHFEFIQGYAEFLPFNDFSFDTVIMATSLDHVLLPQRVIREVNRVLNQNGSFIIWEGVSHLFHGSFENYNPYSPHTVNLDNCHLFRFTPFSLIRFLSQYFSIDKDILMMDGSIMLECKKYKNK